MKPIIQSSSFLINTKDAFTQNEALHQWFVCFVIKGEDKAVFLIVLPGEQISYYGNAYYHFGDSIIYI